MLVFKSCDGFFADTFHMLCCTAGQCDIQYSKDALTNLGYADIAAELGVLTCHDTAPQPPLTSTPVSSQPKKPDVLLVSAGATVAAVLVLCGLTTVIIMRRTRQKTPGSAESTGCRLPFTRVCSILASSSGLFLRKCLYLVCCAWEMAAVRLHGTLDVVAIKGCYAR